MARNDVMTPLGLLIDKEEEGKTELGYGFPRKRNDSFVVPFFVVNLLSGTTTCVDDRCHFI